MCQPLLTHSQAANTPAHQQPRKTATRTAPLPTRQPTHPLFANHRSHITHPSTLPQHNNRRKQPIHDTPPATDIPDTHQCVSHHSHIAPPITIGPAMCQPPLTHNAPAGTPTTQQPRKTANPRHATSNRHLRHPQMCQPPLAHCVPDHHQPRYVPATTGT